MCFKELFLIGQQKSAGREKVQELVMERDCKWAIACFFTKSYSLKFCLSITVYFY